LFTLEQIGVYAIALSISQVPAMFSSNYGSRLLYPLYSQAWRVDPSRISAVYYSSRRAVSLLYAAGVGSISGSAPLIIRILYDVRYEGAAVYLMILTGGAILALSNQAANEVLTASGRYGATLTANLFRLMWLLIGGSIGILALGPVGLVLAVGSMELPPYLYNLVRLRRIGVLDLRQEALQVLAGIGGVAAGWMLASAGMKVFFPLSSH
jgi:O-antigen/teichoic acid export membrane protein